jgi:hypothetical protein
MTEKKFIGRVYKLISEHTNDVYVGSTERTLEIRLLYHNNDYKKHMKGANHYTVAVEILKHGNVKIELIYEGEFSTRKEMYRLEGQYQLTTENCINKCIAGRTDKEYNEAHKDKISEYQKVYRQSHKEELHEYDKHKYQRNKDKIKEQVKLYRQENKDKIKEHQKNNYLKNKEERLQKARMYREENKDKIYAKITCECGVTCTKKGLKSHLNSNKHQTSMKTHTETEPESV